MMNRREREAFDRYITGNYGEDQHHDDAVPKHEHDLRFIGIQDGVREGICRVCCDLFEMPEELTLRELVQSDDD